MTGRTLLPAQPRSSLRQATRSAAARVLVVGLNAAAGIIVARALQPEGRGVSAMVIAVAGTTIALGYLSVEQAHVLLWPGRRDEIVANSVLLGPAVGALAALGAALVVWVGTSLGVMVLHPGMLAVALVSVPAAITALYLGTALVLDARVAVVNRSMLCVAVLQCGVTLLLAAMGSLTPGWVVTIWSASSTVALLVLLAGARPRLRCWSPTLARRAVSVGMRFHPGSASLYLTYRLDVLILGALASPAAVGLYTLAVTLGELTRIPTEAVRGVFLPRQAEGDRPDAAEVTARATRISALLAAVSVGGLCLTAPVLVPIAYGTAFADSVHALYALGPGLFALQAGRQIGAFLIRHDRPLIFSALPMAALAVSIAANLALIPRWGIVGCALAASVSYTLLTTAQVARFCRATGIPWHRLLPGPAEIVMLRRWLARSTRLVGVLPSAGSAQRKQSVVGPPPEDELVAAPAAATGREVEQLEAAVPREPEDLFRPRHLERVPPDPVDEVVTPRHATGYRPNGPAAGHDCADQLLDGGAPVNVHAAERDEQRPAQAT